MSLRVGFRLACGAEVRNLTLRGGQATKRGNPGDRCLDRARPGRGRQRRAPRARPRRGGAPPRGRGPAHPRLRSHLPPGTAPILGAARARVRGPRGREPRSDPGSRSGTRTVPAAAGIRGARRCRSSSVSGLALRMNSFLPGRALGVVFEALMCVAALALVTWGALLMDKRAPLADGVGVAPAARRRGADLARTAPGPTLTFRARRLRVPRRRAHVPPRRRCGARARHRSACSRSRSGRFEVLRLACVCLGAAAALMPSLRRPVQPCGRRVRPDWVPAGSRRPWG